MLCRKEDASGVRLSSHAPGQLTCEVIGEPLGLAGFSCTGFRGAASACGGGVVGFLLNLVTPEKTLAARRIFMMASSSQSCPSWTSEESRMSPRAKMQPVTTLSGAESLRLGGLVLDHRLEDGCIHGGDG